MEKIWICPAGFKIYKKISAGQCPDTVGQSAGQCPATDGQCPATGEQCPAADKQCPAVPGHCPPAAGHCPTGLSSCDFLVNFESRWTNPNFLQVSIPSFSIFFYF